MAESLLLPVVRGVASKAADTLVQSVTGMWGVDEDRGKLERQLLAVHRKLGDAEVKSETDPAVKRWMKDLKPVAYEADDVLDDFQYEVLRREAQVGGPTTRKHLAQRIHRDAATGDASMRSQIHNESAQLGVAMQHLGAMFLELGRTMMMLRMGPSPSELL